jgi:hypothetical protein
MSTFTQVDILGTCQQLPEECLPQRFPTNVYSHTGCHIRGKRVSSCRGGGGEVPPVGSLLMYAFTLVDILGDVSAAAGGVPPPEVLY